MPSPDSPFRTAGLAVAGFALFAAAYVALAVGFFGGAAWTTGLGVVLGVAGIACHIAALRQSLRRWQMTGRAPLVALAYAALGVVALGWWASGPFREAAFYRDNPGAMSADLGDDGIDIRDERGAWHVPFAECPGAHVGTEIRMHDGAIGVADGTGVPFMRLYAAERRVECVPGGGR